MAYAPSVIIESQTRELKLNASVVKINKMSDHISNHNIVSVEINFHQRISRNVVANAAKYRSILNQIHFAKKRNLEEEYTLLQGKLFLAERLKYSCSVGLLSIEHLIDASNYFFDLQYHSKQ